MRLIDNTSGKIKAGDYLRTLDLSGLAPAAERILRAIAFFTYESADAAIPGWVKLCRRARIRSRDTLARHLATLESRGLIRRRRRSDKSGKGRLRDQIEIVGFQAWRSAKQNVKVVYTYCKSALTSVRDRTFRGLNRGGLSPIIGPSIYSALNRYAARGARSADHEGGTLYDEGDFQSLVGHLASRGVAA